MTKQFIQQRINDAEKAKDICLMDVNKIHEVKQWQEYINYLSQHDVMHETPNGHNFNDLDYCVRCGYVRKFDDTGYEACPQHPVMQEGDLTTDDWNNADLHTQSKSDNTEWYNPFGAPHTSQDDDFGAHKTNVL